VAPAVSLRDIGATALGFAGVTPKVPFPGVSLSRYWTDAPDSGSTPVAQLGRNSRGDLTVPDSERMETAVLDDRWHLVRYGTRPLEELFEYRVDSTESRNMLGATEAAGVPERLRERLRQALVDDRPANYRDPPARRPVP
jgi:arylsulfatase A-like enzyme